MELGKRITEIRKENNMTQEELAEKFHVTRQTISNWENGKSYPDVETLVHISNEFNVSLDMLMKGDKDMVTKITKEQRQGRKQKRRILITMLIVAFLLGGFYFLYNSTIDRTPEDYVVTVKEITHNKAYEIVITSDKRIDGYYIGSSMHENSLDLDVWCSTLNLLKKKKSSRIINMQFEPFDKIYDGDDIVWESEKQ